MAPQYKLTYGDARGLGETARFILHYAGVPFEDERIDWPAGLEKIRHVPLLTIDGNKKLAQSYAIYRYLARQHGLGGKDDYEQAVVDSYGDFLQDLALAMRPSIYVKAGRKEGNLDELAKEAQPAYDKFSANLDKILAESGSGFFLKSGPTWPDFVATNLYETAVKLELKGVPEIKGLKAIYDKVKALPQLQPYLSSRKDTQF